ncbi:ABC transporter permease [Salinivirga cyanobacteriivorans]
MSFARYIAKRYNHTSKKGEQLWSKPMMRIAVFGIILGMIVMITAVAIITGFKNQIREKVTGFSAHIQLVNRDLNRSYEYTPVDNNWDYLDEIQHYEGVNSIHPFITKPGVIKKDDEIEAIVLKGVDSTYSWSFFNKYLISGEAPKLDSTQKSNGILLSAYIANRLKLKVGDRINMFFMQKPIRLRRFTLAGIYQTNLKTFDELYAVVDLRHLQKLNNWEPNQYSGFEIMVNDFDQVRQIERKISSRVALEFNSKNESLQTISTLDMSPQIYDWLQLQNMNVWVILILITLVAGINMITGLLINILEKTNQIGLFKAMGATDKQIIKIFMINAAKIIGKGMIWGNIIGITLCYLQQEFGLVSLDPDSYYLSEVPINFNWTYFILLNAGAFIVNLAMMILPSLIIARIRPVQAIKFN